MWPVILIIALTLLSGLGDAEGFTHASRMWAGGRLGWGEFGRSAAGFAVGILAYWLAVRSLNALNVVLPEIQTLLWFGVTMFGVALISGKFLHWQRLDQLVALGVLAGIGWLLFRTGG